MRARQLRSVRFVALALCLLAWSLAPGTASAAYPAAGDQGVVFSYQNASAGAVFLAGDFNGWNAADLALSKDSDGVWTVAVPLEPGTYEYKFVVDGNWLEDPDNPQTKSDPFGGSNSLITIADDGSVVAAGTTAPKTKPSGQTGGSGGLPDDVTLGRPVNVDGGILFTYDGANANSVYLAGSFNDWNAQALPLSLTDGNVWAVVTELPEGANTYKFVVDGNWFADPENPETEADPYGGVNSLVNVDAAGEVVEGAAAPADEKPMSNTALNAKIYIGGRYITRMEWAKNVLDDPRYRLQRPAQSVDLNFETTVSDLVSTYMRMRLDSDQNIIQNNVAAFLDEANLQITPDNFNLKAYWNQEVFTSDDLIHLAGDVDLSGTIGHDHLNLGKGTAGAVFNAEPFGVTFRSLFANTYNDDYYNDPDLYDNTGRDIMAVRLSRRFGSFEVGLPAVLNRSQIWMGFEELVGAASTGIPAFDEYLAESGDDSKRFETENHNYNVGLDLRYGLPDENLELGAEVIFVDDLERIVTGEDSGPNQVNGAIDVPFLERQSTRVCGQIKWEPSETSWLRLRHIYTDQTGATADQRHMELTYQDQSTANKNIYFEIQDSPALTDEQYTDLEGAWSRDDLDLKFWIYRKGWCRDYGINNQTVPGDSTRTQNDPSLFYVSGLVSKGKSSDKYGRGELEFGLTFDDPDAGGGQTRSYELIARYERDLSRTLAAIADVRFIHYNVESRDADTGELVDRDDDFLAPFLGVRYRPLRKLEVVAGYGVDPVDYSIDYAGRQLGRWWYRQNYLFDNPDADQLDAEDYLAEARVFTVRAQLTF